MDALVDKLRIGFEPHAENVEVEKFGERVYQVRFEIDGRQYASSATPIGAGHFAPEETTFIFATSVHDPLEAFGRRIDWRMIDGFDPRRFPDGEVRSGKPADVAPLVKEAALSYARSRWGAPEGEAPSFG